MNILPKQELLADLYKLRIKYYEQPKFEDHVFTILYKPNDRRRLGLQDGNDVVCDCISSIIHFIENDDAVVLAIKRLNHYRIFLHKHLKAASPYSVDLVYKLADEINACKNTMYIPLTNNFPGDDEVEDIYDFTSHIFAHKPIANKQVHFLEKTHYEKDLPDLKIISSYFTEDVYITFLRCISDLSQITIPKRHGRALQYLKNWSNLLAGTFGNSRKLISTGMPYFIRSIFPYVINTKNIINSHFTPRVYLSRISDSTKKYEIREGGVVEPFLFSSLKGNIYNQEYLFGPIGKTSHPTLSKINADVSLERIFGDVENELTKTFLTIDSHRASAQLVRYLMLWFYMRTPQFSKDCAHYTFVESDRSLSSENMDALMTGSTVDSASKIIHKLIRIALRYLTRALFLLVRGLPIPYRKKLYISERLASRFNVARKNIDSCNQIIEWVQRAELNLRLFLDSEQWTDGLEIIDYGNFIIPEITCYPRELIRFMGQESDGKFFNAMPYLMDKGWHGRMCAAMPLTRTTMVLVISSYVLWEELPQKIRSEGIKLFHDKFVVFEK